MATPPPTHPPTQTNTKIIEEFFNATRVTLNCHLSLQQFTAITGQLKSAEVTNYKFLFVPFVQRFLQLPSGPGVEFSYRISKHCIRSFGKREWGIEPDKFYSPLPPPPPTPLPPLLKKRSSLNGPLAFPLCSYVRTLSSLAGGPLAVKSGNSCNPVVIFIYRAGGSAAMSWKKELSHVHKLQMTLYFFYWNR